MNQGRYEVLYIDKFTDTLWATTVYDNLRLTFGLKESQLEKLSCGNPVVIKKKIDLSEAERYRQVITAAGGVAWIQELGEDGEHRERREQRRRVVRDRRAIYRASAILPDRRQNRGRRTTDQQWMH